MITIETKIPRAEAMEAHRQALIDAAIGHEQVMQFIEKLYEILARIGRDDVVVSTQTQLENNGVRVRVMITYHFIFPEQSADNRKENERLRQAEKSLLSTLVAEGVGVGRGIDNFQSKQTQHVLFQRTVSYQGELLSD